MSFRLRVRIRNTEGTMVRLLGTVQRRNYHLLGVTAVLTPDSKVFNVVIDFKPISVENQPPRPPEVLERMVLKLVDVEKVELEASADSDASSGPPPDNGSGQAESSGVVAKKGGDKA